jgi:sugar phosphate isomerase/epimerase
MAGNLENFLLLKEKIVEIHLHDSDGKIDHIPLGKGLLDLNLLKKVPIKDLPLIMEYGGVTSEKEMLEAKKVADSFLARL